VTSDFFFTAFLADGAAGSEVLVDPESWMWAGISPLSWWAAGGCAVPPLVASPEISTSGSEARVAGCDF
jgi:hypothetical protein